MISNNEGNLPEQGAGKIEHLVEEALEAEDLRLVLRVEIVQVGGVQQVQPRQLLPRLRQVRFGLRSAMCMFHIAW